MQRIKIFARGLGSFLEPLPRPLKAGTRHLARLVSPYRFYLLTILVVAVLTLSVSWLPFALARHVARTQYNLIHQAQVEVSNASGELGSNDGLSYIQVGQLGPPNQYAQALIARANDLRTLSLSPPIGIWTGVLPTGVYGARYISAVNTADNSSRQIELRADKDMQSAKDVMTHDGQVTKALVNILSYNPTTDFQSFNLNSSDTQKRLNLAENGLLQTQRQITLLQSKSDPGLKQILSAIQTLQNSRNQLAGGGPLANWVAAINLAQSTMVNNRQVYWQAQAYPIATRLQSDAGALDDLLPAWRPLYTGQL